MMFGVPLGVQRINEPWNPSMIPEIANGTGFDMDPSLRKTTYRETAGTNICAPGDTCALLRDPLANFSFNNNTEANEPLVIERNGFSLLEWADSTDILNGSNSILAAQNAIPGQTVAYVLRSVPAFGSAHRPVNIALNGGGTKFSTYFETDGSLRILSRRIATDAQDARVGPTLAAATYYVIVAGVNYPDASKRIVLDVNGVNRIDDAPAWTGGDTCEALNAASFTLGFAAAPPTSGAIAQIIWFPRFAGAYERSLISNYLNSRWKVY